MFQSKTSKSGKKPVFTPNATKIDPEYQIMFHVILIFLNALYLLAFFVGEADHVTGQTKHGVEVRVFTPLGKKSHGEFALHMGIKCLEYYEDYFDVKYPLPKCDQIGLDDFSAGAMENWGLVTYRSNCLLIDPENSSTASKERVAIVVAHELAHQWFGK